MFKSDVEYFLWSSVISKKDSQQVPSNIATFAYEPETSNSTKKKTLNIGTTLDMGRRLGNNMTTLQRRTLNKEKL